MKQCHHCGALIDDNARFCTSCGNPYTQPLRVKSTNNNSKWYYIGGGVTILILIGFYFYTNQNRNANQNRIGMDYDSLTSEAKEGIVNKYNTIHEENFSEDKVEKIQSNTTDESIWLDYPMHHYLVYRKNELWGLSKEYGEIVTPPIYLEYEIGARKNYIIFKRQDGRFDFYYFSRKIFDKPIDNFTVKTEGTDDYIEAHSGNDIMLFESWRGHTLAPLKAYKQAERMLLCRFKDGSFAFCSVDGLDFKDELKHPRRLICKSSGEDLVVCEEPDGTQHVFKQDGWGYSTFTPEKWDIIEHEYLKPSTIEDPVFEQVYEHEPSMHTIFERLKN